MNKHPVSPRSPQPIKASGGAGEAIGDNASLSKHNVGAKRRPEGIDL
jgi:hypothetical protein